MFPCNTMLRYADVRGCEVCFIQFVYKGYRVWIEMTM